MRLRPIHLALTALAMAAASSSFAAKLVTPGYLFNSDPTCREIDGRFYLFATQDPFTAVFQRPNDYYKGMYAYHAYSTTDFDNWVDHGSILTSRDVTWNGGAALWDGDAGVPANSRFYAYAPFRVNSAQEANYGWFEFGVFIADRPEGPYRDVFNGPMRAPDGRPIEGLSPSVIPGDDGRSYLMWGSGDTDKHEVWIAALKSSMTELAEAPRQLRTPSHDACGNLEYFESPILLKAKGRWLLTWIAYKDDKGAKCDPKGSYVRYASADDMFGPFDREAPRTLIYPTFGGVESTQQGMCVYRGREYLAYHVPYDDMVPYADHHRQVAITRLAAAPDGSLKPVYPESDEGVGAPGVSNLTLDAFAPRREAAEFHVRSGVSGQKGLSGEFQMKMKAGGYLLFRHMDFGGGARSFHVEFSAEAAGLETAVLEVRLDGPAGPLLGTAPMRPTGGPTTYQVARIAIAAKARGVHDLVLVARGRGGDRDGHLFNITSFGFESSPDAKRAKGG